MSNDNTEKQESIPEWFKKWAEEEEIKQGGSIEYFQFAMYSAYRKLSQQKEAPDVPALVEKLKYRSNAAFRTSKSNGGMAYWDGVAEAYDSVVNMLKQTPSVSPSEEDDMIGAIRRHTDALIAKGPDACREYLRKLIPDVSFPDDHSDLFVDWLNNPEAELKDMTIVAERNPLTISDYEECLADHRRLVREIDVIMNGEEGAAKQASLCDLVGPIMKLVKKSDNKQPIADSKEVPEEIAQWIGNYIGNQTFDGHNGMHIAAKGMTAMYHRMQEDTDENGLNNPKAGLKDMPIVDGKAWPLGGYAPGNYFCKCFNCHTEFRGDKRAVQCMECAVKMVKRELHYPIGEAMPIVEPENKYREYLEGRIKWACDRSLRAGQPKGHISIYSGMMDAYKDALDKYPPFNTYK